MDFYYENHLGEQIKFYDSPYILTSHSFVDWKLTYDTVQNVSSGFRIDQAAIPFAFRIMPRIETPTERAVEYKRLLNEFVSIVSKDVDIPGKLWTTNGQYLVCRIISSKKSAWHKYTDVTETCELLCDHPVWITEKSYEFLKPDSSEDANRYLDYASEGTLYNVESGYYLDYVQGHLDEDGIVHLPIVATEIIPQSANLGFEGNGEYPYDYMCINSGQQQIVNDGDADASFALIIYGEATNPYIIIDDILIGINAAISEGEYIVVDVAARTVYKVDGSGQKTNLFNSRTKENSIFQKIKPGTHKVIWPGTFGFDIKLNEERREPKWT